MRPSYRLAALLVLLGFALPPRGVAQRWQVWENCRLIDNPYNDGDSFHVAYGQRRYVIRLFFVDAPETDMDFPDRVAEQARYFGVDERTTLRLGHDATRLMQRTLGRGTFTVYTRRQSAGGRSHRGRYFGFILVNDRYFCEILVEQGLARLYGYTSDLPDGTPAARHQRTLRNLKVDARRERRGGWGAGDDRGRTRQLPAPGPVEPQTLTLSRPVGLYASGEDRRLLGTLQAGAHITVIGQDSPTYLRVRYSAPDGRTVEGLVSRWDLGL